jgi:hypothetical protein
MREWLTIYYIAGIIAVAQLTYDLVLEGQLIGFI